MTLINSSIQYAQAAAIDIGSQSLHDFLKLRLMAVIHGAGCKSRTDIYWVSLIGLLFFFFFADYLEQGNIF